MTGFLARVALVIFAGMVPIVLDTPDAMAKPHEPVQCIPVGVTTKPDGSVWAIEDCNGDEIQYRFGSSKRAKP
jgi:hypothetical protein